MLNVSKLKHSSFNQNSKFFFRNFHSTSLGIAFRFYRYSQQPIISVTREMPPVLFVLDAELHIRGGAMAWFNDVQKHIIKPRIAPH